MMPPWGVVGRRRAYCALHAVDLRSVSSAGKSRRGSFIEGAVEWWPPGAHFKWQKADHPCVHAPHHERSLPAHRTCHRPETDFEYIAATPAGRVREEPPH